MQARSKSAVIISVDIGELERKAVEEIIKSINALLNTSGGKLELCYKGNHTKKAVENFVRTIEQKVGMITMLNNIIVCHPSPRKIVFNVTRGNCLSTLSSGLFLPTKYQVMAVPPEMLESAKRIMEDASTRKELAGLRSYNRDFVLDQNANFDEDENIQCKALKSEKSKCVRFVDRMTDKSNKFTCYISAFANYIGGHIYYGIDDNRVVKGQIVSDTSEMESITEKVQKTIKKMKCRPGLRGEPKRGKQWDIFFEPVKDSEGKCVPSTYVIVVAVARCPGGVFAEEPESYCVSDGKVVKMDFSDWMRRFSMGVPSEQLESVPSHVPRVPWSSSKNQVVFQRVKSMLVMYRNNNCMKHFKMFCMIAVRNFPESLVHLVIAAEKISVAIKNQHFQKAEKLLRVYTELITSDQDAVVFQVLALYLRSRLQRSMGQHEESYKVAQDGLQIMQLLTPSIVTVWFYIHVDAVEGILAGEYACQSSERCIPTEHKWLDMALRDADTLNDEGGVDDLRQKLHIYLAMSYLSTTLTGQTVGKRVTSAEINRAESKLQDVLQSSVFNGNTLTHFRESQFKLANSDLYYRKYENCSPKVDGAKFLKSAFHYADAGRRLAEENHFEEVVRYANNRRARITEKLVKNADISKPCERF